jgi:heme exporter protein D
MWKEFLKVSQHDPWIWLAFAAGTLMLFMWRAEVKRARLLEQFALARGFKFDPNFNRAELHLSKAHFFSWRDRVKNAIRGSVNGRRFILFEQRANRGKYKSFTRTIVAFEIDPSTPLRSGALGGYGLQMEKTSNHLFVWQAKRRVPVEELEPFLHSTVRNVEQAIQ